jgi:hypothetical protein
MVESNGHARCVTQKQPECPNTSSSDIKTAIQIVTGLPVADRQS